MAEVSNSYSGKLLTIRSEAGFTAGQVIQMPDGRAGWCLTDIASTTRGEVQVTDVARMAKTTGIKILKGGRVYWDHSANQSTYKPVDDRDFYVGTAVDDAESGESVIDVNLNVEPNYLIDLMKNLYRHVPIGTLSLSAMGLYRRGGGLNALLSSTSEAQKLDAISVAGFATGANAIIDFVFSIPNDGAGTAVDVSIGIANATHATDADSITEHVFIHLDANATAIKAQSKDGSTTVTATDTTTTYTEGSATANLVYVTMDMRDPADVQIYVNGVLVLPSTVFNVNAAVGPWHLLFHIEKTSAADVYELDLHEMRVRICEQ